MKCICSSKHIEAKHALQKAFLSPLVLCLANFQKAFKLESNASDLQLVVCYYNIKMMVLIE